MQQQASLCFVALAFCLAAACGGEPSAVAAVGVYHLDTAALRGLMAAEMKAKGVAQEAIAEQLDVVIASVRGSIDLRADGSAALSIQSPRGNQAATSTWQVEGNSITLTGKGLDGKDDKKTARFADGAITIEMDMGSKQMALVFRRK